jgi:hypothetical protein
MCRGGKWLVAISVAVGAQRLVGALHHHKDSDDGSDDALLTFPQQQNNHAGEAAHLDRH